MAANRRDGVDPEALAHLVGKFPAPRRGFVAEDDPALTDLIGETGRIPMPMRAMWEDDELTASRRHPAVEQTFTGPLAEQQALDEAREDGDRLPVDPPAEVVGKGSGGKGSGGKPKGSLARSAASGARVTMLGQLARFAVQIGGLMIMSRLLGPAEVGLVAMVTAIVNIAEIVRDFGLSSAAVSSKDLSDGERTNLFWANLGIGTLCAVVVAAGSGLMASFYGEPRVQGIALALAGVFIMSGANTQLRADLSRNMRFGALARSDVLAQVIAVSVAIFAAWQGASYWAVVIQQATQVGVGLLSNAIQCRWWPGLPQRDVSIRRFLEYGRRVLGTNLLGYALNNVDNVGLSYVWGKEVVGLYSRAFNLLQMPMTQINAPLGRVALPVLSKVSDDRAELQRYFTPFQRAVCYVLGLGFGMMAALASPLVRIMLGPEWGIAGPILTILAIGGVFKVMDSANYQIWLATGQTKDLMRFYLWTRPVMMLMILAGLPWGSTGVAWSGTIAAVLHWIVATWYLCRRTQMVARPLYTTAATSLLGVVAPASLVAWFVCGLLHNAFLQLLAGGLAGLAAVALVAVVAKPVRRDLKQLGQLATLRKKG